MSKPQAPNSLFDATHRTITEEIIGDSLAASATKAIFSVNREGFRQLEAQVKSSGSYDVVLAYLDTDNADIRTITLASGVTGGNWTDISRAVKYPHFELRVVDNSAAQQSVDATINFTR